MKHVSRIARHGTLALALVLGAAACSSGNVLGPDNQLSVTNNPGSFQIQAIALDNVEQTLSYTWESLGTMANVNQSGSLSGTATLTITDADGTQVYSSSLTDTGTFQTDAGTAGNWTIVVVFSGANGALDFRVQNP